MCSFFLQLGQIYFMLMCRAINQPEIIANTKPSVPILPVDIAAIAGRLQAIDDGAPLDHEIKYARVGHFSCSCMSAAAP